MNKYISAVCLTLIFSTLSGTAQESSVPQRVLTSTGIFDVESCDDIYGLSARDLRKLIQMENTREQGIGTIPHPILVYCFDEENFHYTGGKYQNEKIKYRLHKPKNVRSGRNYPLIVHLHGIGEAGSNNTSSLVHLHSVLPVLLGSESEDFFMLVTQCSAETPGWSFRPTKDGTLDVLVAIMEHVIAEYPIDTQRITTTGVSSGGWGVWELLMRYPDTFAGAVPTSSPAPSQLQRLTALKKTPVWSFVNKGDVSPESILTAMRAINNAGGSMAFTECNPTDHNAWRPAMEDYQCFRWMLAQKRESWFAPPPGTIVHQPNSWWFILVMCVVPLTIFVYSVFRLWDKIYDRVSDTWQTIRERISS